MTENKTEPMCLTVDDLCGQLQISRPTAYSLVHSEGFPVIRVGRRLIIPKSGLERWLEDQANLAV